MAGLFPGVPTLWEIGNKSWIMAQWKILLEGPILNFHDYGGERSIALFVVPLHDFLQMMWRRSAWFQKQQP